MKATARKTVAIAMSAMTLSVVAYAAAVGVLVETNHMDGSTGLNHGNVVLQVRCNKGGTYITCPSAATTASNYQVAWTNYGHKFASATFQGKLCAKYATTWAAQTQENINIINYYDSANLLTKCDAQMSANNAGMQSAWLDK